MKSVKYDLQVLQGATFGIVVTLKQANGLPMDLTGYTGRGQVRENLGDPRVMAEIEVTFLNPRKSGQLQLKLTPDQTKEFNFLYGVYDVKLTTPLGEVMRILQGKVLVDREVTK